MSSFQELLRHHKGPILENFASRSIFLQESMPELTEEEKIRAKHRPKRKPIAPPDLMGAEVVGGEWGSIRFLLPDGRTVEMGVSGYEYDIEWEEIA